MSRITVPINKTIGMTYFLLLSLLTIIMLIWRLDYYISIPNIATTLR
jgi:hypothetical protein